MNLFRQKNDQDNIRNIACYGTEKYDFQLWMQVQQHGDKMNVEYCISYYFISFSHCSTS